MDFSSLNKEIKELISDLKLYRQQNDRVEYLKTISLLVNAVEKKDAYTARHTERVTLYSLVLFDELNSNPDYEIDFPKGFRQTLKISALLHDIGKIGIRDCVLNKPGRLTDEEFEEIKKHPSYGYMIGMNIEELDDVLLGVKHHHERYDGKGYPDGLKGDEIPIIAAIISVADAYDAMTSDRPYRKSLSGEIGRDEIMKNSGTQFHPLVVKAFLKVWDNGKI